MGEAAAVQAHRQAVPRGGAVGLGVCVPPGGWHTRELGGDVGERQRAGSSPPMVCHEEVLVDLEGVCHPGGGTRESLLTNSIAA